MASSTLEQQPNVKLTIDLHNFQLPQSIIKSSSNKLPEQQQNDKVATQKRQEFLTDVQEMVINLEKKYNIQIQVQDVTPTTKKVTESEAKKLKQQEEDEERGFIRLPGGLVPSRSQISVTNTVYDGLVSPGSPITQSMIAQEVREHPLISRGHLERTDSSSSRTPSTSSMDSTSDNCSSSCTKCYDAMKDVQSVVSPANSISDSTLTSTSELTSSSSSSALTSAASSSSLTSNPALRPFRAAQKHIVATTVPSDIFYEYNHPVSSKTPPGGYFKFAHNFTVIKDSTPSEAAASPLADSLPNIRQVYAPYSLSPSQSSSTIGTRPGSYLSVDEAERQYFDLVPEYQVLKKISQTSMEPTQSLSDIFPVADGIPPNYHHSFEYPTSDSEYEGSSSTLTTESDVESADDFDKFLSGVNTNK